MAPAPPVPPFHSRAVASHHPSDLLRESNRLRVRSVSPHPTSPMAISGLVSSLLHMLDLQQPGCRSKVFEATSEHGRPGRFAGVLVGVASQLGEPEHGFGNGGFTWRRILTELEHLQRTYLKGAEVDGGWRIRVDAGKAFEAFDAYGHCGDDRGPPLNRSERAQLGGLDVAVATFPSPVKLLHTPALGVAPDDGHGIVEALDGVVGVEQPVDRIFARRCSALFTRPNRSHGESVAFPVVQPKDDLSYAHDHACFALATPSSCDNLQAIGARRGLA